MFLVDTNILVYACDEGRPEQPICRRLLDSWRIQSSPWFTTWPILYEFLRVSTHGRVLRKPLSMKQAVGIVEALLASPALTILIPTERHVALLAQSARELSGLSGSTAHDLATAVLMREHGIRRIVTRDADFQRFPFVEVVDPFEDRGPDAVHERSVRRGRPRSRVGRRA